MSPTIRDVAKHAGVGVGTVSRVLNDHPLVSDEMREHVRRAIRELGYTPNIFAQRLSSGKSLTIGIVAPWFTRPSVVERVRGIEQVLSETRYDLNIFNVETVERRQRCFADIVRYGKVDGLILISTIPNEKEARSLKEANIATVQIDATGPFFSQIAIDDVAGGTDATNHLIAYGHQRIAFISDHFSSRDVCNNSQEERFMGYKQALEASQLTFRRSYVRECQHSREVAQQVATELMTMDDPPTGIVAASDTLAIGVLEAAKKMGLRVPEDLSVIGYDDIEVSTYLDLTTIRQPLLETGIEGAELLLKILNEETNMVKKIILPTEIIERGTTGAPRLEA